jgi:predicted ATP-grasp superfamily ATP-dependent carboligase
MRTSTHNYFAAPRAADPQGPAAFILDLRENGYGVLRSLAYAGVRTIGFYTQSSEFGRLSRRCETHYLPPAPHDAEICQILIEHGERAGSMPVLFPTSDYYTYFLARHREELSKHFRFHWVDAQDLGRMVDKAEMSRLCYAAGVLTPRTHVIHADEDLSPLAESLSFPCLIKPNRSFDSPFPPRLKNFIARSFDEFRAFYAARPELKGATVCQEIIEGGDENILQCTALVGRSGDPGAAFCTRKLHQYRPGYGVMCFGRSEENEVLTAQTLQLLRFLRYQGLASLEFKYRAQDGRYYFIEMNPRLPWYNSLFIEAQVNLPYLAYLDLTGNQRSEAIGARQRDGVYWVSFKANLGWLLLAPGRARVRLFEWLVSLVRARSYAWFDWRDPQPFLRATLHLFSAGIRYLFGKPSV